MKSFYFLTILTINLFFLNNLHASEHITFFSDGSDEVYYYQGNAKNLQQTEILIKNLKNSLGFDFPVYLSHFKDKDVFVKYEPLLKLLDKYEIKDVVLVTVELNSENPPEKIYGTTKEFLKKIELLKKEK